MKQLTLQTAILLAGAAVLVPFMASAAEPPNAGTSQKPCELDRTVKVQMKYLLALPKDYDKQDSWPLLLFLHGAGERGNNLEVVKKHGPPKLIEAGKDSIQTWVKLNGCEPEPKTDMLSKHGDETNVTRKIYGGGKEGADVVLIVIEDGGHTFHNGKPAVAPSAIKINEPYIHTPPGAGRAPLPLDDRVRRCVARPAEKSQDRRRSFGLAGQQPKAAAKAAGAMDRVPAAFRLVGAVPPFALSVRHTVAPR